LYFSDKAGIKQKLSGVMSRVDIKNPLVLLGLYTQVMMLSLVWKDKPEKIYVIGFGGGRMPMTFYHYFPNSIIESTEIDPSVVDISQKYFGVVLDGRIKVHIKDGRQFLSETSDNFDIILIDTYSGSGIHPLPLATQEFYKLCKSHIRSEGVVVTNLVETDFLFKEKINTFIQSFDRVFDYMTEEVHVLFGSNSKQIDLKNFLRRAKKLDKNYSFAFPFFSNAKKVKVIKFDGKVTEELLTTTVVTDSMIPQKQALNMNSKVGRNELCPCGSGKKYKKCHLLFNS
jgi:spermidine synthase